MYAVIQTGGKQYRVQPGDILQVEKLEGEVGKGLEFKEILFVGLPTEGSSKILLGAPHVKGAMVMGEIVGQGRGDKIRIVKYKRRKQYRRTQGHRQDYTQFLVTSIDSGAGDKLELSASDKKTKLAGFRTQLKPKGLGMTPKTLGSRKRMAEKAGAAGGAAKAKTSEAKAAPAKATTSAAKKSAKK